VLTSSGFGFGETTVAGIKECLCLGLNGLMLRERERERAQTVRSHK